MTDIEKDFRIAQLLSELTVLMNLDLGNIKDLRAYLESLPPWTILKGCFGSDPRLRPTDIDGCVERYGASLFLEWKREGAYLKGGQSRLFQSLSEQGNTVIVAWYKKNVREVLETLTFHPGGRRGNVEKTSTREYQGKVTGWWGWANAPERKRSYEGRVRHALARS